MASFNRKELSTVISLASIFALRMLGLFMILPVFAVHAQGFSGANNQLIGIAIGAYGLSQALLQIPFGFLSDQIGRKPVMIIGLIILALGSFVAAKATSIEQVIIGRLMQGSGAIGCVVMATLADHTRDIVRTKAMAILGAAIGGSFFIAMMSGPLLQQWAGITGIFWLNAILSLLGILLVWFCIPKNNDIRVSQSVPSLYQLNTCHLGIFCLHASLAALFLQVPVLLYQHGLPSTQLPWLYLSVLAVALVIARKLRLHLAIFMLLISELILLIAGSYLAMTIFSLVIFFAAFCMLEITLPTIVAKSASLARRGMVMGVYSSLQFFGIFVGGLVGGWLQYHWGSAAILVFCMSLSAVWLAVLLLRNEEKVAWQEV